MIEDCNTLTTSVIPADAGIQLVPNLGKPGFRLALRLAGMTTGELRATPQFDNRHSAIFNSILYP